MRSTTNWRSSAAMLGSLALAAGPAAADTYAEDRAEIEDLQARYMFALDFRDPEAYAATFTEDGVLDYGAGKIRGREAIAAMVRGMRESAAEQRAEDTSGLRPAAGRHNITNIVIEIDGDRATDTANWFHMGNDNPDRAAQLNSFGHYEDELVKVDGEWLFSLRKIYNEQVEEWVGGLENPVVNPGPGPGLRQPQ
ncbi:MAG TPA: nuclear transport factor 2 family protein [Gammaproteobacteria bacterium]|nr:nuclear transport factor 2 family protein [Gammaproteobacteria bacterium]